MSSQASQKTAILSVYNKTGLLDLARGLAQNGVRILASGGTATLIRGAGMPVDDVSSITNAPEMLDGSVKTLHPAVHAGILARDLEPDEKDLAEQNIGKVNYVVCNLYPFKDAITKINVTVSEAVEKIDIAGVTLLRAAAKNHSRVTVLSDPADYATFLEEIKNGEVSEASRKLYALKAFEHTADYDSAIAEFFRRRYAGEGQQQLNLRYGENPHQSPAQAFVKSGELPIKVLSGSPGYINLLDALHSWPLVKELKESLGLPAATSFKHVSPAGAAVGITLSAVEKTVCFVDDIEGLDESPLACAYARARGAERMSSLGDWIALSDTVDVTTAKIISREVSDGVIAPSYDPEAFDLLKEKGGKYTILKIDPLYEPPTIETRQVYGVSLSQQRNDAKITARTFSRVLTPSTDYEISPQALIDLTVATIALKYTQSNSVCYAKNGQIIGLGVGQQSRTHCTRLAGDKADKWWFRQHPKILDIKWKRGTKRPDKSNAIDLYVSGLSLKLGGGMGGEAHENVFDEVPEPLTSKEIEDWRNRQAEVAISSDGSFPFVDSVFRAHRSGAKYMAAPGGSAVDKAVHEAAGRCGIVFVELETRLFHH